MSETPTSAENEKAPAEKAETPAKPAATATAEKPAAPAEPPFTVDALLQSTARFTHKAWHLFYNNQKDMTFIRETPVRATLDTRSATGAEEIHRLLAEDGIQEISRQDKTLYFTATFEQIQKIIKHPQTYLLDAVKI